MIGSVEEKGSGSISLKKGGVVIEEKKKQNEGVYFPSLIYPATRCAVG